jgi:hypothetical protein
MKQLILILAFLNIYSFFFSQATAITRDGRKVILYDDFTWRYADEEHGNHDHGNRDRDPDQKSWIKDIDVDSYGMVSVEFRVKGERIVFYDGKLIFDNIGQVRLEYHNNSFFTKSVGKIKRADFGDLSIEFEYHQVPIFDKSEGKIKTIRFGDQELDFEYHQNSFFTKSVGKVKNISSGMQTVNFEYDQNSFYPENEGKLKEISGEIKGIGIRYID